MASLLLTSHSSLIFLAKHHNTLASTSIPKPNRPFLSSPLAIFSISKPNFPLLSFTSSVSSNHNTFSSIRLYSTLSDAFPDPDPLSGKSPATAGPSKEDPIDESSEDPEISSSGIVDEWGEKAEVEPEAEASYSKLTDADPPADEDEWGRDTIGSGNGSPTTAAAEVDKVGELKRCLVDTVYGTNFGFEASTEVRAEVLELVNQLETANPTPVPTEAAALLDGNWVLLYTAFSELLPLLAAGATPLLKVKKISQEINTSDQSIVNSTTLSSPFATFSFSASASFEVRSPSRIQVEFKEGKLQPPEIESGINLPENVDLFGQKINLMPVQQTLNPLQEAVANISRSISGQPPLRIPIPGNRSQSWLLITFLDEDLRISRGDGGLFVLAKEGSPLLDL